MQRIIVAILALLVLITAVSAQQGSYRFIIETDASPEDIELIGEIITALHADQDVPPLETTGGALERDDVVSFDAFSYLTHGREVNVAVLDGEVFVVARAFEGAYDEAVAAVEPTGAAWYTAHTSALMIGEPRTLFLAVPDRCYDSDGGKDVSTRGYVLTTGLTDAPENTLIAIEDSCGRGTNVNEKFCDRGTDASEELSCGEGKCVNARCTDPIETCDSLECLEGVRTIGPEDASHTIVVFSDATAPVYATWYQDVYPDLERRYLGDDADIRLVFVHSTFFSNPSQASQHAARAQSCAVYRGYNARMMHEALVELSTSDVPNYTETRDAIESLVPNGSFADCIGGEGMEMLEMHYDYAKTQRIVETPSVLLIAADGTATILELPTAIEELESAVSSAFGIEPSTPDSGADDACEDGTVTVTACGDGTEIVTRECVDGGIIETGRTCADAARTTGSNGSSDAVCDGCEREGTCYPAGARTGSGYCSDSGAIVPLKGPGASCGVDPECVSSICEAGSCIEREMPSGSDGVLTRVMTFLARIFGFGG